MKRKTHEQERAELEQRKKEKKAAARKPFTDSLASKVVFVKRLAATVFALAIFATGAMAAYYGHNRVDIWFWSYAVRIAGAFTITDGVYLLYWALMKVGQK